MARPKWGAKRKQQGFSYDQVRAEIERRYRGEHVLEPSEAKERYERALSKLELMYKLSALLNDFLDEQGMEYKDLVEFVGTNDDDASLAILLDPFGRSKERSRHPLRSDVTVDSLYPGSA